MNLKLFLACSIVSFVTANISLPQIVGGYGPVLPAGAKIQKLINQVRSDAEREAEREVGEKFSVYVAEKYRVQSVAGTNYLIKVYVGGGKYAHLLVFEPLQYPKKPPVLNGIKLNKKYDDPLEVF
ncbi:cystatin-B-like [Xenia sp. Carnegie-2017]|uniref:cystatin-B-like n=1 Tax=Xenia sp. Carnegie-2017 TaxID=2897299 RepID=UPI001F039864|nr:cystatin-B-like [Xenia sp. Carnegie-2017]XP_046855597.1 cystatin-B-like [Xenia sp. Carnegie-2017]